MTSLASKNALNKKRAILNKKRLTRKNRQSVIMNKLDDMKKAAKRRRARSTMYRLQQENKAISEQRDKENLEFENDAITLLQSLESEKPIEEERGMEIPEIETALALGQNKIKMKKHLNKKNKSISGAKIVGKIKYKGGKRRRRTRRKKGKGTVQSRKKRRKTKKRKKRRK